MIPIISCAYGVYLECRMLDKIMYVDGTLLCLCITKISFSTLLIDRYYDRLLPLLRQFLHIPNWINKSMDLTANCSTPCLNQFCWDLINTWWSVAFIFSIANSNSAVLGSDLSGSAGCISVCLISLTPCISNSWGKWFLHLTKRL
jgi:hypothetical protein